MIIDHVKKPQKGQIYSTIKTVGVGDLGWVGISTTVFTGFHSSKKCVENCSRKL